MRTIRLGQSRDINYPIWVSLIEHFERRTRRLAKGPHEKPNLSFTLSKQARRGPQGKEQRTQRSREVIPLVRTLAIL